MITMAIALHVLSAVVWVGGMFFAYMALRPVAAAQLEPPVRLPLWVGVFERFFPWVWGAVVALPVTGYWLMHKVFGSLVFAPANIVIMQYIGIAMIAIYLIVFFVPYTRLRKATAAKNFPEAGKALAAIRRLIGLNLTLGLVTVAVAAGGRYLQF